MGRRPHVLVVPFPAQGHVKPLMKLSQRIADHGIKVTFVNTETIHAQIISSMQEEHKVEGLLEFVSIPDALEPEDNQTGAAKFVDSLKNVITGQLRGLIDTIHGSGNKEEITCVIADATVVWTLEVAKQIGVKDVAVWPAGPACLALSLHIPKLIEAGVIDADGNTQKHSIWLLQTFLSPI